MSSEAVDLELLLLAPTNTASVVSLTSSVSDDGLCFTSGSHAGTIWEVQTHSSHSAERCDVKADETAHSSFFCISILHVKSFQT